jgi:hypothetical protein
LLPVKTTQAEISPAVVRLQSPVARHQLLHSGRLGLLIQPFRPKPKKLLEIHAHAHIQSGPFC